MLPPVDIAHIAEEVRHHAADITDAFELQEGDRESDPGVLISALDDLFDCLRRLDEEPPERITEHERYQGIPADGLKREPGMDIHQLGEYGIDLLARLAGAAAGLQLPEQAQGIAELGLPFACWIARHGGELGSLGSVVDGAATLANRLKEPAELAQLYALLTEVLEAVDPRITQETGATESAHPWRVLLLNRAIVATRSHQPALMRDAFQCLADNLPEAAAAFFREGMEQMEALNYPHHVRAVMRRYYEQWCGPRVLH